MIELYHNDMSVCAQKVRFALAEKKLVWESHHLNLRAGDQQQPEYLKLNPNAVVPTLVDEGTVIIESTVINEFIDDAYPEARLKPSDAAGRARMRLWTKQLDESVHAATSVVSSAIAFRRDFSPRRLSASTNCLATSKQLCRTALGSQAKIFPWPTSATLRTSLASIICSCNFSGTNVRTFPSGTTGYASAAPTAKRWRNGSMRIICR